MSARRSLAKGKEILEPCERLPWDTKFFGVETARVREDWLTRERVKAIDAWSTRRKVRWLYFLARADDAETAKCAEQGGFALVDARVTYERAVEGDMALDAGIRKFEKSDLPALLEIARTSYRDSRFYYDGHIAKKMCDEYFETWTKVICEREAGRVLVATSDNKIKKRPATPGKKSLGQAVGYVTLDRDEQRTGWGKIELLAVAQKARGAGVGERLVKAALACAAGEGLVGMTVVTQGRNIAAQRLYQRCGFIICSLQLYYHKWYE